MSEQYEIEIRSLLQKEDELESLRKRILENNGQLTKEQHHLNHYFIVKDISHFKDVLLPLLHEDHHEEFKNVLDIGKDFSIRTKQSNDDVLIVVKASLDEGTSTHAITRAEFEKELEISLEELDQIMIDAGFSYQSKWSRNRQEYVLPGKNITICLDKTPGYGYVAEFETVVDDKNKIPVTRKQLMGFMGEWGLEEIPQERLERMFQYYNDNWADYYGTDNVFVVK